MIRCPRCNNELPDGVAFCDACGAPIRGGLPPASPVPQPYSADPAGVGAAPGATTTVCPGCGHALITRNGNQFFIEDLNSVNGTLVNQRRIPPRTRLPLHAGDHLVFGRLGLTFEQR